MVSAEMLAQLCTFLGFISKYARFWGFCARLRTFIASSQDAESTRQIGCHSFRRTFATLLKGGGGDVKAVQELMRQATSRLTLDAYAQALTPAKRAAHLKLVGWIQPVAETANGPL